MSETPAGSSVEYNGVTFQVESNKTAPSVEASPSIAPEDADDVVVETSADEGKDPHAVALGKRGGEAAAKARKEASKPKEARADNGDEDEGERAKRKTDEEIKAAPPEQKKKLASDRVAEATRAAAESRKQLERERSERAAERRQLEERLSQIERRTAPEPKPEAKPDQVDDDPEPREEDFQEHQEFLKALAKHSGRREAKTLIQSTLQSAQQHQRSTAAAEGVVRHAQEFEAKAAKEYESDPSITERLNGLTVKDIVLNSSYVVDYANGQKAGPFHCVNDEIMASERPLVMAAYLSANPDFMKNLLALPSRAAISKVMAKLEARLEGATAGTSPSERKPAAETKPEVSKANPPARPVAGPPAIAEEGYKPGMSIDDYARSWNKTQRPRFLGGTR